MKQQRKRSASGGPNQSVRRKAGRAAAAVSQREALALVMKMMAIPGRSGQEGAIMRFITDQLSRAGAPAAALAYDAVHRKSPQGGEVGNLILKLPGTQRGPRRLLMAHVDTVPVCVGAKPVLRGDFVHSADPATGLGGDDRAGAAVVLLTALEILRRKLPHPPLTFLWTVQEEVGLQGARQVRLGSLGKPRLAFNWDGNQADKLTLGATGGYRMKIEIRGRASHAGVAPDEGVSAVAIASLAIADLVHGGWHGRISRGTARGTSNVGVIHGGEATNVVMDRVELRAEARSHDPEFRQQIVEAYHEAFRRAAETVRATDGTPGTVRIDGRLEYESFLLSPDEPCILAAEAAVRSVGLEPMHAVADGGLDANWMSARGIPTVTLGCGQTKIHTVHEQLDVNAFHLACKIGLWLATAGGEGVSG